MKRKRTLIPAVLSGLMVAAIAGAVTTPANAASDSGLVRHMTKVRTVSFPSGKGGTGSSALFPEGLRWDKEVRILTDPNATTSGVLGAGAASGGVGSSVTPSAGSPVSNADIGSNLVSVGANFKGLNFYQHRFANGGNQFSVEPPDQGLCVGSGFVLEVVNTVLRVYNTSGTPQAPVVDLNTFYGYPAQFNRTTGDQGPFITDPNCYYDPSVGRWFVSVATLDVDPVTGDFTGTDHLDIATSNSSNPTGSWTIFSLPTQDDGTQGTPDHHCDLGPCTPDFPQLSGNGNAIFITSNEYSLFNLTNGSFTSANIYAFSKADLVVGALSPTVVQFATPNAFGSTPGYSLWPAKAVGSSWSTARGGTEFFLNTMAAEQAGNLSGHDNRLGVWAVVNTSTIDNASPALHLKKKLLTVNTYYVPPLGQQKAGNNPLGQCLNDTQMMSPFWNGKGCWKLFFPPNQEPAHSEQIPPKLETSDTDVKITGTYYAAGDIWGVAATRASVGGHNRAGVTYYIVHPSFSSTGTLQASLVRQGRFGLAGNDLLMPTVAATSAGKGIIAFTRTGGVYPSAAFTTVDATNGTGSIQTAAAGVGPDDGFTGYVAFVGDVSHGARWGDYSMGVTVGGSVWLATEYINQTCSLSQTDSNYLTLDSDSRIGTCGKTRGALGNWATRIWKVTP